MKLCLDSLTVGDTEPAELIRCAGVAGFDLISPWAQPPAIRSYRPALELGAQLGAKTASAINLQNADPAAVSELFAQFAELARERRAASGMTAAMQARAAMASVRHLIDQIATAKQGWGR